MFYHSSYKCQYRVDISVQRKDPLVVKPMLIFNCQHIYPDKLLTDKYVCIDKECPVSSHFLIFCSLQYIVTHYSKERLIALKKRLLTDIIVKG